MREEGDSSDDVGASVFVHKDGDIANNQCVHVELIEVFYDYFNLKENLNLPSEVQSDAHFRPVDKLVVVRRLLVEVRSLLVEVRSLLVGVRSLLVGITRQVIEVRSLLVSEQLYSDDSDEEVFKKKL